MSLRVWKVELNLTKFPQWVKTSIFFQTRELPIENRSRSCYPFNVSGKLKTIEELQAIIAQAKANGRKVVFTNGCFDLLHRGHLHTLRQAKACGDVLVVGINSDRSVKGIKGSGRPIMPESDRVELLAALEMVDYVITYDDADPYRLIAALLPDVLVKGGDWAAEKIIGADIVEHNGGKVAVIPYLPGFSTTEIIERIRG